MNKKLIVAAVSAAVALPVAAQAEITVYGRVNNAIDINDLGDDSTTDVSSIASRFGLKGSTDIGNGLTAHGQYEFDIEADRERDDKDRGGNSDVRVASAGVSGSFGRIDIGNQWSAYFNTFGTMVSPSYSIGYYLYSSIASGPYRSSNTIKYSNSFGGVALQVDVRLNDDTSPEDGDIAEKLRGDGFGVGITFPVTSNIKIALAADSEDRGTAGSSTVIAGDFAAAATDDINEAAQRALVAGTETLATYSSVAAVGRDEDRFGAAIRFDLGSSYWLSLGWQNYETSDITYSGSVDRNNDGIEDSNETGLSVKLPGVDIDSTYIYGGGNFNPKTNWVVGLSNADDGIDAGTNTKFTVTENGVTVASTDAKTDDSSQLFWGVYHNVGGGLRLYYEAVNVESENAGYDGNRHLLGLRVDF